MNNLNNDYKAQGCSPHLLSVSISGQNTFLIRYKKIQMKLFGWSGEVLNPVAWSMSRWTDRILILNLSQPGALQLFNSYKSALIRTLRSWLRSNSCTASQRVPKLFSQTRTGNWLLCEKMQRMTAFIFFSILICDKCEAPCDLHNIFKKKISSSIVFPLASQL